VLTHRELLVRLNFQIGTRTGGAEQNESGCSVLGKIGYGIACIELARIQQPSCTG